MLGRNARRITAAVAVAVAMSPAVVLGDTGTMLAPASSARRAHRRRCMVRVIRCKKVSSSSRAPWTTTIVYIHVRAI